MSDFASLRREHIRLTILQLLQSAPDYTLHESLISDGLKSLGLGVGRDELRIQLAWLDEQGLIIAQQAGVWIATLTVRGEDAAAGRVRIPGVARPRPGV
jgi:repressor of nif and glnA expression